MSSPFSHHLSGHISRVFRWYAPKIRYKWPLHYHEHGGIQKWLVDLAIWKMMEWKSVGMMTFPIYGKIKAMFQTTNQMVFWNVTTKMVISWNPKKITLPSMARSWNDHWWNFDSDRTTTAPPRISSNPSGRSRRNEPMLWVVNIGGSGQVEDQH